MAMLDLTRYAVGKPVALADVAQRQNISLSYLEQLIARLKAHHLVKSTRGPGGGYMLGDRGDQITVGEIVEAVDDPHNRILIADPLTASVRQLTDYLWQSIGDQIDLYLKDVTLAQVNNCTLCAKAELTQPTAISDYMQRERLN
jgi:Rrf2 family iron-sulfur cluster assembly transcriptional regulator